jgi:Na+-transporting NADH:ubiquinone oxidoreductase subunit B
MRILRSFLDRQAHHFEKGGRLEKWFPLWEAADTFFYTPPSVARGSSHVRDAIDLKRMMILVVIAALPCVFMAMYNTGLQANLAIDPARPPRWRAGATRDPPARQRLCAVEPDLANLVHGALYFLPLYAVTMIVGLTWEVLFAVVRKIEVNEGFFVTGLLFPLILPPPRRCGRPRWASASAW